MRLAYFSPIIIFLILLLFLWRGLHLDPRQLPSVLLNKPIPTFDLPTVENANVHLSNKDFSGKVSLLNVWATWCLNCRAEHAFLMDLVRQQAVTIYGLAYKDDTKDVQSWLQNYGNPYQKTAVDSDGKIAIDLGVYGTPETFVIDKQGIIRYKIVGALTTKIWRSKVLPLVVSLQSKS